MNETLPDWTLPSAKAPPPTPMKGTPRTMAYARSQSSPVRFLSQVMGLEKNPHDDFRKLSEAGEKWSTMVNEANGVDPVHRQRLLAWGVSCEGEGRTAYLRTSYSRLPQCRGYWQPATSNQLIGYYAYPELGQPMKLYPAGKSKAATKQFMARTSLSGMRRPDRQPAKGDAMYAPAPSW
jgi:hypothetical protein